MSHSYRDHDVDDDHGAFRAFYDRRYPSLESNTTTVGSKALATLAGLYFVFKALEALGYPVWLWIHMATERIASLRFGTPPASGEASEGDTPATMAQKGSNALGRLLGLSGANLLQKGVRGVRALSTSAGSGDVPPGLGNWDNSCFQNSVIQGLASLPSLREYLYKTTAENRSFNADTTNGALFDIIRQLGNPNHPGGHFWIRGKLKNMSTFQQQDAQEYYSKVLDALDKEMQSVATKRRRSSVSWAEVAKSLNGEDTRDGEETAAGEEQDKDSSKAPERPTILPNPLDGLLAQRVGCINCGYSEGLQLIPFNCLTVSLGATDMCDIRDCLDEYTTLEYIEGVECAKCTLLNYRDTISKLAATNSLFASKLQTVEEALEDEDFEDKTLIKKFNILKKNWKTTTKSKQAVIARAPKALVMHVNRSIFDEWTGYQRKNNAHVAYPRVLDLGNWCLGEQPSETSAPDNAMEEWPRDPTKSMLGDTHAEPVINSPFQYRLRAAVTHSGTHGSGHYICYRPHPKKTDVDAEDEDQKPAEQWWRFSDESVWPVSEEQAHQGNVFMLFYERIDQPTTTTPENVAAPINTSSIPLPPAVTLSTTNPIDPVALSTALPLDSDSDNVNDDDDDDEMSLPDLAAADTDTDSPTPPSSIPSTPIDSRSPAPIQPTTPSPSPAPQHQPSATPSEADSEDTQDTQSTLMTSDDESTVLFDARQLKVLRTAGGMEGRGQAQDQGVRRGLPLVTAT